MWVSCVSCSQIGYFFYKNVHFGFTLFYYESYAVFSGQAAYNDWYMTLFNVFFTSLPVIALGILEQDISARMKLQFPHLYQQGIKNLHFDWIRILGWIVNGVTSSLIVFYFTIGILQQQAFREGGEVSGLEVLGATLYTCVIWTVNCELALFIKYFTWLQHVCIWGSILLWFLFVVIYGYLPPTLSTTAYRVFIEACAPSPTYWLTILIVTVAAIFPSFVFKAFQSTFFPTDDQIIQEFSHLQKHRDLTWLQRVMSNRTFPVNVGLTAWVDWINQKQGKEKIMRKSQSQYKVSPLSLNDPLLQRE